MVKIGLPNDICWSLAPCGGQKGVLYAILLFGS